MQGLLIRLGEEYLLSDKVKCKAVTLILAITLCKNYLLGNGEDLLLNIVWESQNYRSFDFVHSIG